MQINLEKIGDKLLPKKINARVLPILRKADIILSGDDENSASQRIALITFTIRVISAFIALVSQILLARWLGTFEYGIYVAIWVVVIILSTITCIGFPSAVVRYVGQYRESGQLDLMHGIIRASMYISLAFSAIVAGTGAFILYSFPEMLTGYYIVPVFIAAVCLPMLAVEGVMDCIARAFSWPKIAFIPTYILRPLFIIIFAGIAFIVGFPANAETTMWAALIASFASFIIQYAVLFKKLNKEVPKAKPTYQTKKWIIVALPIFLVEGFYTLMTSVDILFVSALMRPEDTAVYFATTKILALVHFVYFAVRASVSHRYSAFHTNGDLVAFQNFVQNTVSWTFWPSVLMAAFMAIFGKYFLMLFGSEFTSGSFILIVLLLGIVIRSSIGPAEALLVMADRQKMCAGIYAVTLGVNVVLNLSLIPIFGILGAAIATSIALAFETASLHAAAKRTLGLHAFIIPRRTPIEKQEGSGIMPTPPTKNQQAPVWSQDAEDLSLYTAVDSTTWRLGLLSSIDNPSMQNSLNQLAANALVPNAFYETSILNAAVKHLTKGEVQYLFLSKQQGDEETLKFFMPVTLRRIGISRKKVLQSWTHQYAPLGMPLIDGDNQDETLTAFIECIHGAKHQKATAITIEHLAKESPFINALYGSHQLSDRLLLAHGIKRAGLSPIDNLDYIKTHFSGKRKQRLNKAKNDLQKLGKISFHTFDDVKTIKQTLEDFLKLESSGWKGKKNTALNNSTPDAEFCRETVNEMMSKGQCIIHTMKFKDETIASLIWFESKGSYHPWKVAFNEDYAKYSVGNLLSAHATAEVANTEKFKNLDSLAAPDNKTALWLWPDEKEFFTMIIGLGANATRTTLTISSELNRMKGLKEKAKRLFKK